MIHPLADQGEGGPASFVSRDFTLAEVRGDETLRVSALGFYRAFINGERIGEALLTPGWSCYDKRVAFQTYPVAKLLREGVNRIEIWLADGWYRSQIMWRDEAIFNCWGDKVGALAEILSGDSVLLRTDGSWGSGPLPVLRSGIYFGEIYDARLEGQAPTAGVEVLAFDTGLLVAQECRPVRELAPFSVRDSWTDREGRTIYDFGQNAAGYVAFRVRGAAGARVIVEHSEIVDRDREVDNRDYRTAAARIEYILKGGGVEPYRPHFTFQGFRYARVTVEGEAALESIELVPISSVSEATASFECGNPLVNRLVLNTLWSQRSNFIEVPTDCPQRDERLGWTGDAQVFAATACYLHDSHAFLRKYLREVMADQRPNGAVPHFSPDPTRLHPRARGDFAGSTGWGDVITVLPWVLWRHYGDREVLAETLPAMVRWIDFVWSISGPIVRPPSSWGARGFTFGDWLQPVGDNRKPEPNIGDDCAATIYLYVSCTLAAKAAAVVGDDAARAEMQARADEVKAAFAQEFITPSGRLGYNDQTSYALAFLYDLIPAEHVEAAKRYFRRSVELTNGKIGTGFIGTPAILPALVKIGATDLAERLFLQLDVPGWLHQVERGATTIWERWDSIRADGTIYEPDMNSYNHYAYGAVCQWLFEAVAGFRPDEAAPGFRRIVFEPTILPALGFVRASHDSAVGRIEAGWMLRDGAVDYAVEVPDGAEGVLVLGPAYADPVVDGVALECQGDGTAQRRLAPGPHRITFRLTAGAAEQPGVHA
jgi:alpha-L-rhamnosidase